MDANIFTAELISERLTAAYGLTDEAEMADEVSEVIDMCRATGNRHLLWFSRLLENHFEGVIAHATFGLSSGKVEGTNRMIKGVRSQGYGYPDDEYFFLKLFDASRRVYVRNHTSFMIEPVYLGNIRIVLFVLQSRQANRKSGRCKECQSGRGYPQSVLVL